MTYSIDDCCENSAPIVVPSGQKRHHRRSFCVIKADDTRACRRGRARERGDPQWPFDACSGPRESAVDCSCSPSGRRWRRIPSRSRTRRHPRLVHRRGSPRVANQLVAREHETVGCRNRRLRFEHERRATGQDPAVRQRTASDALHHRDLPHRLVWRARRAAAPRAHRAPRRTSTAMRHHGSGDVPGVVQVDGSADHHDPVRMGETKRACSAFSYYFYAERLVADIELLAGARGHWALASPRTGCRGSPCSRSIGGLPLPPRRSSRWAS
jgi:hypothetical protein